MARSTTRSQRVPKPSQSQANKTQRSTQRAVRRGADDDDEQEEEEDDENRGDEEPEALRQVNEDSQDERDDLGNELSRRANDLVRLALFTEQKRIQLRREDIYKKVLGENRRVFKDVLAQAQKILKKTFGMELVELKSRIVEEKSKDGVKSGLNDAELEDARNATGVKRRTAAAGSKTYILRSVLDPLIIEQAAQSDEAILTEEAVDLPEDENEARSYGSLIAWSSADQLASLGILHIILALILVSGRVLSDADLRSFLRRMRLLPNTIIPSTNQSTHKSLSVDTYLTNLIRQGYLDRRSVGDPKAKKGGGAAKRIRSTQGAGEDDGITWEWRWGNRAHSEVGEQGIAQFVAEFMVQSERMAMDEEEGEGEGRAGRKRREKQEAEASRKLEVILRGIKRAAGGELNDIQ